MTATAAAPASAPATPTQAQPAAAPAKAQPDGAEQAQGGAEPSIRDKLIAKAVEKRAERERGPDGKFQPKTGEQKPAPGKPEGEKPEPEKAEAEADEPIDAKERHEFRARMRKFHKWAQKTESQLQGRAQQIQQAEHQVNELLQLAERDPVEFLRKKGKDLREILLKFTEEDSKDPVLKRAEEAERLAKEAKAQMDALEREKQEAGSAERANQELRQHYAAQYQQIGSDFPLLREHSSSLAEVAEYARREAVEHFQKHGTELDAYAIFGRLERRLKAFLATKTTSKEESPDRVRTVASREAVNPETSRRRSADVSPSASRINSETQIGRMAPGHDARRAAIREQLIERTRELRNSSNR